MTLFDIGAGNLGEEVNSEFMMAAGGIATFWSFVTFGEISKADEIDKEYKLVKKE